MAENVLGGRYTVQDRIGTGGMAVVYRGLDNVLGRTVAIKNMLPQYANDPSFAARFKQEAQAAAALQSPYIVSIYDWGKDGDTYYIVMEYIRGTDLKSGIRKHGALDSRKVAQIGLQISQALSVAHRHEIIHRDIKPQNIMVQPDGNIKVMDFGIAHAKNAHITTDNSVLGTAHYVSPEQTQGKELGPTSDIYSLGIVMYEAATGRVPFEGEDAITVALKQVNEQPAAPSSINPNVDPALESIILKCMQKNPDDRFQSADELARVLRDYLAGRTAAVQTATSVAPVPATTPIANQRPSQVSTPLPATSTQVRRTPVTPARSAHEEAQERERKGRTRLVVGVALVVAILGIAAYLVWGYLNRTNESHEIPNLSSLTEEQAVARIERDDIFTVGDISTAYSSDVDEGKVISQNPSYGSTAKRGTKIDLVVSQGEEPPAQTTVPSVLGMTRAEAEDAITKRGLVPKNSDLVFSETFDLERVAEQSPAAGTTAKSGDTVTFHLSKGPDEVEVPNVVGDGETNGKNRLTEAGFTPTVIEYQYSDQPLGIIIWQSETGTLPKGSEVQIVVSNGPQPQPVTTPTTPESPTSPESPASPESPVEPGGEGSSTETETDTQS